MNDLNYRCSDNISVLSELFVCRFVISIHENHEQDAARTGDHESDRRKGDQMETAHKPRTKETDR